MARELKQPEMDALEKLVDDTSLEDVLRALAYIADLKADHIAVSYSDTALSTAWEKASIACANAGECVGRVL